MSGLNDLDFAKGPNQAGSKGYDPFFSGMDEAKLAERKTGFEAIPGGDQVHMKVVATGSRKGSKSGTVSPTIQVQVIGGTAEQTGRKSGIINLLWLNIKPTNQDGEPLTAEELADRTAKFKDQYARLHYVLQLKGHPSDKGSAESVAAWIKPAMNVEFIGDLRKDDDPEFGESNRLLLNSLARLEDPTEVKTEGGGKKTVTALEAAKAFHARKAAAAAKKGKTLGSKKATGPGLV